MSVNEIPLKIRNFLKRKLKPFIFGTWLTGLKIRDSIYRLKGYRYNLSICAMFQNEARWLKEWIDYHRLVGVDHFWLYNNNSDDNYLEILAPYIQEGIVELIEWPTTVKEDEWKHFAFKVQTDIYKDAVRRSKSKTIWLAAIDVDEFLYSPKYSNISDLFNTHYHDCYGVCVNWQCYGTSGVDEIKDGELLIEKITMKAEAHHPHNLYHKTVMRPQYIRNCQNPHFFDYVYPAGHVNATKDKIDMYANGVHIDLIRLNHYWSKDKKFFNEVKIPRWIKWGNSVAEIQQRDDQYNSVEDDCLNELAQKLKRLR